jgi:hypothetical protein
VEDSYRLLVHYIEKRDDSKRWWHFTAERKAYREQHGFPANRPKTPWYESEKYPKMNGLPQWLGNQPDGSAFYP